MFEKDKYFWSYFRRNELTFFFNENNSLFHLVITSITENMLLFINKCTSFTWDNCSCHLKKSSYEAFYLEDNRMVLSNYFRKWCLSVLENDLPAMKKELLCHRQDWSYTIASVSSLHGKRLILKIYVPMKHSVAETIFFWWTMLASTRIASEFELGSQRIN